MLWLLLVFYADIRPGQHANITVYGGLSPSYNQLGSYCLVALVIHDDNRTTLLPGCTQLRFIPCATISTEYLRFIALQTVRKQSVPCLLETCRRAAHLPFLGLKSIGL